MRPTFAIIDLDAIAENILRIKKHVHPSGVMAVVKADGYGHGAVETARTALAAGATHLGVALPQEGVELRQGGIQSPILVFGGFFVEEIQLFLRNNLDLTLYSKDNLEALEQACKEESLHARVHLKVDTGMGRVGAKPEQAAELAKRIAASDRIEFAGIYTHFASADEEDKTFARLQLERFLEAIEGIRSAGIPIPLRHAANSAAILDMPESHLDMVRAGILIYGYYPSRETSESVPVRPALTLKSRVIHLHEIGPGDGVSYGRTFIASGATRIATIPIGYADGYNRLLSNAAMVSIGGKKYPVSGTVCMDQTMVDLGHDQTISIGDEVVLVGQNGRDSVPMALFCQILQTIPYEICTRISERVPRLYKREKQLADT